MTKYVRENDAHNSLLVNPGGLMGIFRNSDNGEWQIASTLDGFLNTFRLFVQSRDGIALYSLEKDDLKQKPKRIKTRLLDLMGLSPEWYKKVKQAYDLVDNVLASTPDQLTYNGEPITRWKVLKTFLYGDGVHSNTTHRETFKQWRSSSDLFEKLQLDYLCTLSFLFGQILEVAETCKSELNQKPADVEKRI